MKKIWFIVSAALLALAVTACSAQKAAEKSGETTSAATPDSDWALPETTAMTEEVTAIFEKAISGLTGVRYEPAGYLGAKDGVYCILCRATAVSPEAKPYYALVYVNEEGVRNIWEIWMGAHAEKKE